MDLNQLILDTLKEINPKYSFEDIALQYLNLFMTDIYQRIENLKIPDQLGTNFNQELVDKINEIIILYDAENQSQEILLNLCLKAILTELFKKLITFKSIFQVLDPENNQPLESEETNFIILPMDIFLAVFYNDILRVQVLHILPKLVLSYYNPITDNDYSFQKYVITDTLRNYGINVPQYNYFETTQDAKNYIIADIISIFSNLFEKNLWR